MTNSYALFSPEARFAQHQVVVAAPPPLAEEPTIIRTISLRELPFTPFLERLQAFRELPEDWDSYGAAKITTIAMATARAILRDLSLRPAAFGPTTLVPFSIAPVATGGINLEWRRSDAALEIWIAEDGKVDALIDRRNAEPRFDEKSLRGIPAAVSEVLAFAG